MVCYDDSLLESQRSGGFGDKKEKKSTVINCLWREVQEMNCNRDMQNQMECMKERKKESK